MTRSADSPSRAVGLSACGLAILLLQFTPMTTAQARGPWHAAAHNTARWHDMSHRERVEHQRRMRGFTRYSDCVAYETERQQPSNKPGQADLRACDELRALGRLR